jgi:hypothetical protein
MFWAVISTTAVGAEALGGALSPESAEAEGDADADAGADGAADGATDPDGPADALASTDGIGVAAGAGA